MSDDWQPGDLALCLPGPDWIQDEDDSVAPGPSPGQITTVRKVGTIPRRSGGYWRALWFIEWPGETDFDCFDAREFRKIRPHEADEEDRETIRLLTAQPQPVVT
jgi:hypothetical protein